SAGADELINYTTTPLKETVKEMTGGDGVDVVYDPVGGEFADQAFRATAWHGRYLVIGFADGEIPKFAGNIALLKEASIIGVWWGTWAAKNPEMQAQNVAEISALIAAGKLTPRVTDSYPLDDYVDAFNAITERRARGKVVITF
ncbi:MAG: zinc-binding dehydrogenase, partial [Woeseiaceae bacterium]